MDNTQPIIDLTNSYPPIHWPRSDTIIELLDDSIDNEYPATHRENRARVRSNEIDTASTLDTEPRSPRPPNRKTKNPRSRTKKTTRVSKLAAEDNHDRDRSRSPISFGECPICCEELGKNPLASTKCGHVYCIKCLEQSLRTNKRCPTCRRLLKGRTGYHPLYISEK